MKKGDTRKAATALLQRTTVHMIVFPVFWFFLAPKLYQSFIKLDIFAAIIGFLPWILAAIILTYGFWCDVVRPWYELLCESGLIERTIHVNSKQVGQKRFGHDVCYIKSCEVHEALQFHKLIPDDFIVDERLTIGYLPKSKLILYVDRPAE